MNLFFELTPQLGETQSNGAELLLFKCVVFFLRIGVALEERYRVKEDLEFLVEGLLVFFNLS